MSSRPRPGQHFDCGGCNTPLPRRVEFMKLDRSKVSYQIHIEVDDIEVRGNAVSSGDEAYDRRVEDEILQRLEDGDTWAWAAITVTAHLEGLEVHGADHLGACSYASEEQFRECPYFADMCEAALDDLEQRIEAIQHIVEQSTI